jgi:O-antigen/teichoic acid export membrane protein
VKKTPTELERSVETVSPTRPPTHEPASLLANSTFMLLTRGFTLIAGGALGIYAVRSFSVAAYGRYAVAVALITIIASLSEMGISARALRTMSFDEALTRETLGIAVAAEVVTSVVAAAVLVPVGLLLGYSRSVLILLAIGAGVILFQGLLPPVETVFKARRTMVYPAVFTAVQSGVMAVVGFALIAAGAGPAGLIFALLAGAAAAVPVAYLLLRSKTGLLPPLRGTWVRSFPFLAAAIPIAVTGAVTVIYERIDVLMVSKLDSAAAAAHYSVPLTVVQYTLLIPAVIGTAFFPLLAAILKEDAAAARELFFLVSRLFLFASGPIAIFLLGSSDELIPLVFGDRYRPSSAVLAVLAVTIVFGFQIFLLWYGLLAAYKERGMLTVTLFSLALNVGLNLVLIPAYGPKGAAISLVISDLTILVGQAAFLQKNLFAIPFAEVLPKPLLAAALSAVAILLLHPVSGFLSGGVAALLFAAVLLATRYISAEEWRPLTQPVREQLARLLRRMTPSQRQS